MSTVDSIIGWLDDIADMFNVSRTDRKALYAAAWKAIVNYFGNKLTVGKLWRKAFDLAKGSKAKAERKFVDFFERGKRYNEAQCMKGGEHNVKIKQLNELTNIFYEPFDIEVDSCVAFTMRLEELMQVRIRVLAEG